MSIVVRRNGFRPFLRAVWVHSKETVTGVGFSLAGLTADVLLAVEPDVFFAAWSVKPWMVWGVGLCVLGYAAFLAWRDERAARIVAEDKADADKPHFTGYINWIVFGDVQDGVCRSMVGVSIENDGAKPSVLHKWRLYIQEPNQLEQAIPLHNIGSTGQLLFASSDGSSVTLPASDFLSNKTYPAAVDPGDGRRGFLLCSVPAGLHPETTYILRFSDVLKNEYSCEFDPSRQEKFSSVSGIGHWPGLEIEHRQATLGASPEAGLPAAKALSAEQCNELAGLLHDYHVAVNDAVRGRFSGEAKATLKDTTRRVSHWIKTTLGPIQHQLFESAAPVMETYAAVPIHRMHHWQLAVGKLRYLQGVAQRLCG